MQAHASPNFRQYLPLRALAHRTANGWTWVPTWLQKRSIATLAVLGYIAYAGNNFGAIIHLNFKVSAPPVVALHALGSS